MRISSSFRFEWHGERRVLVGGREWGRHDDVANARADRRSIERQRRDDLPTSSPCAAGSLMLELREHLILHALAVLGEALVERSLAATQAKPRCPARPSLKCFATRLLDRARRASRTQLRRASRGATRRIAGSDSAPDQSALPRAWPRAPAYCVTMIWPARPRLLLLVLHLLPDQEQRATRDRDHRDREDRPHDAALVNDDDETGSASEPIKAVALDRSQPGRAAGRLCRERRRRRLRERINEGGSSVVVATKTAAPESTSVSTLGELVVVARIVRLVLAARSTAPSSASSN